MSIVALIGLVRPSDSFSYLGGKALKGMSPSFAVGPHGIPVVAFYRPADETIAFGMCQDANCEQPVLATPLVRNVKGVRMTMGLDPNGNPLIVFIDDTNKLQAIRCPDIDCEDVSDIQVIAQLDGTPVSAPALAFLPSGLPVIAYEDRGDDVLVLAMCSAVGCEGGVASKALTGVDEMGTHPRIVISNNNAFVFYHETDSNCIRAIYCSDAHCTTTSSRNIVCTDAGEHYSATIGIDRLPVLSLYSLTTKDLRVAKCRDPTCTSSLVTSVDRIGDVGSVSAILSPFDGRPLILYADDTHSTVKVARCKDIRCRGGADIHTLANTPRHGAGVIAVSSGIDGIPIALYEDTDLGTLRTIKCLAATCEDAFVSHNIPAARTIGYNPSMVTKDGFVGIVGTSGPKGYLTLTYCITNDCSPANIPVPIDTVDATLTSAARLQNGGLAVAYFNPAEKTINLLLCRSRDCAAFDRVVIESNVQIETPTSVNVDRNGIALVAYYDTTASRLRIARCNRVDCSTGITSNTLDSAGNSGLYPSLAFHTANLPVVSYQDAENGYLRIVYCTTPTCTLGSVKRITVDKNGAVGSHSSIAVTPAQELIISYHNSNRKALMVAFCATVTCISPRITIVDSMGAVGTQTSIALSPQGFASIAYKDVANDRLKVATCADKICSTSSIEVADDRVGSGNRPTIAVSGTGSSRGFIITHHNSFAKTFHAISCQLANCTATVVDVLLASHVNEHVAMGCRNCDQPMVVYTDILTGSLTIAQCVDSQCWSPYVTAVLNLPQDFAAPDIAATKDGLVISSFNSRLKRVLLHKCVGTRCSRMTGFPVNRPTVNPTVVVDENDIPTVAFYDPRHGDLKVSRCKTPVCSEASLYTVDRKGNVGNYASITIGANGFPIISYYKDNTCDVLLALCADKECALPARILAIDRDCKVGKFTSLIIDSSGFPVISYYDDLRKRVKIAYCTSTTCNGTIYVTPQTNVNQIGVSTHMALTSTKKPMIAAIDSTRNNVVVGTCEGMFCTSPAHLYTIPGSEGVVGSIDIAASTSSMLVAYHSNVTQSIVVTSVECPPGTFLSTNPHRCLPCAPGTYSDIRSLTICSMCPPGTYSPAGSTQCFNCAAVPPAWKQQCNPASTCKATYRDGMYLECMDPDDLYSFTYDHILENKGTLCMRFEKTFSGYIFERTEHHTDSRDGFMVRRCTEPGGCNCTQIVPCDRTTDNCQRPYRCTSIDGRRNCISPIPCKNKKMLGGAIQLQFNITGLHAFTSLVPYKQTKLVESVRRDLSKCEMASNFSELVVVDEDSLRFSPIDDDTRAKMVACIPTVQISGRLFNKASTYAFIGME